MSGVHEGCRHVPMGSGAVYCPRTKMCYIRPDQIVTPARFKKRPDEWRLVMLKTEEVNNSLRNCGLLAYAILKPSLPLPRGDNDYKDVTEFLRFLLDAKRAAEDLK